MNYWRPGDHSPGFIVFLVAVILGYMFLATCAVAAEPQKQLAAPIVRTVEAQDVMVQTGWYSYPQTDGVLFLYCVEQPQKLLTCAVYVRVEEGSGIVLVDNITDPRL